MGYTHFDKVAGHRAISLGKKGEEVEIASVDAPVIRAKRVSILFDAEDLDTGVTLFTMKKGQLMLGLTVRVTTAWNNRNTVKLSIGHTTVEEYVKDMDAKTAGLATIVSGAVPTTIFAADTEIKAKVDVTGDTEETAGVAEIILLYLDNIVH